MIFAQELQDAVLDEQLVEDDEEHISFQSWKDAAAGGSPKDVLKPGEALHVFLASTAGVGEAPDNGRDFFEWIMNAKDDEIAWEKLEYCCFGLGNSKAHPNHFNVVSRGLDKQLEALGARRVMKLSIGDDGDCIEDDFDKFLGSFLELLKGSSFEDDQVSQTSADSPAEAERTGADSQATVENANVEEEHLVEAPPGASLRKDGLRLGSKKHATIKLLPRISDVVRKNLFHLQDTPDMFYDDATEEYQVITNQSLAPWGGDEALREFRVQLIPEKPIEYEAGDHLKIYPRNSQVIVDAYLEKLDVDPHAIVAVNDQSDKYPHPKGLTVSETLSHCVDLGATPSPSFARAILGKHDIDYKNDIAHSRRTVIDLLGERGPDTKISVEDLLYELPPMKARYYSIASSNIKSPKEIVLVFRPCKYMTKRGMLREGVCTSFMMHQAESASGTAVDTSIYASIPAAVSPNPSFRLPKDPETPVMMIAGGCGVAPIRAFVRERIQLAREGVKLGPCSLYLGFRDPKDEVYQPLFADAVQVGALSQTKVVYSKGCEHPGQKCMTVAELVREEGVAVWHHFQNGGVAYLCGGARTFGAAVETEMMQVFQEHGNMSFEESQDYLRTLIDAGQIFEDLAD
jgi:sulfite reductase alpha subunit-like flavoprotein